MTSCNFIIAFVDVYITVYFHIFYFFNSGVLQVFHFSAFPFYWMLPLHCVIKYKERGPNFTFSALLILCCPITSPLLILISVL